MSNDFFVVTNYHLNIAEKHGQSVAQAQIDAGYTEPLTDEELWDNHPQEDIVFLVTGEKMHDVDEGYLILDSFEDGYFRYGGWENAEA